MNIGFPADKNEIAQSNKNRMQDILDQLNEQVHLVELFAEIYNLPTPRLSDEEWEFLENMLELLPDIDKTLRHCIFQAGKN